MSHYPNLKTHPDLEIIPIYDQTYVESSAINQVHQTCKKYPQITKAVAMPDLHPGPGYPIGCAFQSQGECYPELIGGDIGCGMTFFLIPNRKSGKLKPHKMVKQLEQLNLRESFPQASQMLREQGITPTAFDDDLGSLGGGNHFAEFQEINQILNPHEFQQLFPHIENPNHYYDLLFLLVHSGSRRYGQYIANQTQDTKVLKPQTKVHDQYFQQHNNAVQWALANRMLIAHRITTQLNFPAPQKIINIVHNYLQPIDQTPDKNKNSLDKNKNSIDKSTDKNPDKTPPQYIHRKGVGYVKPGEITIIPGSRGHHSYLVKMTEKPEKAHRVLNSVAHGAGRRWNRSTAEKHLQAKHKNPQDLRTTSLNSQVVCSSKALLYQEAPEAYKQIDQVIEDLENGHLIKVIATLKPILTYKS